LKSDYEILATIGDLQLPADSPANLTAQPTGRVRRPGRERKRGRRGGLQAKLRANPHRPSLPSVFLANVRSLTNKTDELRLRIINHKWIKDCNVMIFTESWLIAGDFNHANLKSVLPKFHQDSRFKIQDDFINPEGN